MSTTTGKFTEHAKTLNEMAALVFECDGTGADYELIVPLSWAGTFRVDELTDYELRRGDTWTSDLGLRAEVVYSAVAGNDDVYLVNRSRTKPRPPLLLSIREI